MILVSTSWNSAHITDTIIENGFFVWMVGNYDYLSLDVCRNFQPVHDRKCLTACTAASSKHATPFDIC